MTRPRYRYVRAAGAARSGDDAATERSALLDQPCPAEGSVWLHFKVRAALLHGNAFGREVWERHRTEILLDPHRPGTRPKAHWIYDAPPDAPDFFKTGKASQQDQATYLHAHGLLAANERRRLPKDWFLPSTPSLRVIKNGE